MNLEPKSHQLYVNLPRLGGREKGQKKKKKVDCAAVTEIVQLESLIRSNPQIKWKERKVFRAGRVKSLHPAAGATEKQRVQEMSFNSLRVSE